MKIVIASAGRRAHYIEWFQESLAKQGLAGEVIALEYRENSPGYGLADKTFSKPAYNGPAYTHRMREVFAAERPDLFLCLNDYELQVLSTGLADEFRAMGCAVAVLDEAAQTVVFDKYRMAEALHRQNVPSPATVLGSEIAMAAELDPDAEQFVVKHRFGSGSAGLHIVDHQDLAEAVQEAAETALGSDGRPSQYGLEDVVVQPFLPGTEYGVDGVFSVDGRAEFLGVIARRTDHMLHGDPDVATTVAAAPFKDAIQSLGRLLQPTGSVNVDFREDASGQPMVIDINPRLGGGYPYNHRAGADIPSVLIRSAAGLEHLPELLDYQVGVTSARREEFTVIRQP